MGRTTSLKNGEQTSAPILRAMSGYQEEPQATIKEAAKPTSTQAIAGNTTKHASDCNTGKEPQIQEAASS